MRVQRSTFNLTAYRDVLCYIEYSQLLHSCQVLLLVLSFEFRPLKLSNSDVVYGEFLTRLL